MHQAQKVSRTVLLIAGMRDAACRARVAAALERVSGVKEVDVNLFRATAVVVHDGGCDANVLMRAITEAGCVGTRRPERGGTGPHGSRV